MRVTVPSALATHTAPSPAANEVGRDDSATGAARVTGPAATRTAGIVCPVEASMRETVLSVALATQITVSAAATASGPLPTVMVSTTRPTSALMRLTVRSP